MAATPSLPSQVWTISCCHLMRMSWASRRVFSVVEAHPWRFFFLRLHESFLGASGGLPGVFRGPPNVFWGQFVANRGLLRRRGREFECSEKWAH
eukprot:234852-Pyramimonas_sp.AAC.1